ncbi:MAG: hypothetical protein GTO17_09750 [Candidatus Aminicenantes bacterium]|nr:hypothetical protein [Candidatus Aminicenantes bacterium]
MEKKQRARSRYFQEIAHQFLKSRGAPFFLSSKDLDLITAWEKMGIPLRVALEGVDRAFESYRAKPTARRKVLSLAFCNNQVLKAFEQYKERKVGAPKKRNERDKKRTRIKNEVQRFLNDLPPALSYLNDLYAQALMVLSRKKITEEELERLEEEIEELLFKNCPQEEQERVRKEFSDKSSPGEEELISVYRTKLVKSLREMYKIPYISFFYY